MSSERAAECETPADLVRRIQAGEGQAEEELVRRYSRGVSIIIRRVRSDSFLTDDLCQETFRLALTKIRRGDLREPEKLSGFICSLARNLAIESFRQSTRAEVHDDPSAADSISDPAPDQLQLLLQRERASAIRGVLRELKSARDREVLYRFYIAEEDKDRISVDLGLSSLQFNRVLHRARTRFRELYEKCHQVTS
jgi:RNA polymerase sigma-70 factor (ECF subfamily)